MIKLTGKIGYGFGDMASSIFWKLSGAYLMIFYTDVFGLPAAAVDTMFLVACIWDSVFDPIVGVAAGHTQVRWGKFRPHLFWLAIPFTATGVLTFTTPSFGQTDNLIYAYITYSLMVIVYSAINVPYTSLLGVMSPLSQDRNTLSTYRMVFAYIGSFVTPLLFMSMVRFFSGDSDKLTDQQHEWTLAIVIIVIPCAILFHGCLVWTEERVKPVKEQQGSLEDGLRDLLRNELWWVLLGAGISVLVFNSIRGGATIYYFKYFTVEEAYANVSLFGISFILSGLYLAVGQATNTIEAVLAAPLNNRVGKKRTYVGSMLIASVLGILFFWLDKTDLALIFTFQVFISVCAGSIFPLLWSMYADCTDYSGLRTGSRATGLIFNSSSTSQGFGWAIGTAITGWLLVFFEFQANAVQGEETISGIRMFLSFSPAVGTILSVVFIAFYPLSEARMKEVAATLETKRRETDE